MNFKEHASGLLVPDDSVLAVGSYHCELFRKGNLIDEWDSENILVNEGLNYMLNTSLGGGSAISTWYVGLFSGNYTPVAADAAATFTTNATETTGYTAGARQQFVPAAASAQAITNTASKASFTFNANSTIYGAFLASAAAIGATSGTLMSASQFGTSRSVAPSDVLLITYNVALTSS